ncbi:MAG: hypothetical protein WKG07_13070 [Hymenobacter sp.]
MDRAEPRCRGDVRHAGWELPVYTTRPDTLFGATYVVLAPEHGLVEALTTEEQRAAVEAYVCQPRPFRKSRRTSTGHAETGAFTRQLRYQSRPTASKSRSGSPTTS